MIAMYRRGQGCKSRVGVVAARVSFEGERSASVGGAARWPRYRALFRGSAPSVPIKIGFVLPKSSKRDGMRTCSSRRFKALGAWKIKKVKNDPMQSRATTTLFFETPALP